MENDEELRNLVAPSLFQHLDAMAAEADKADLQRPSPHSASMVPYFREKNHCNSSSSYEQLHLHSFSSGLIKAPTPALPPPWSAGVEPFFFFHSSIHAVGDL